MYGCGNWSLTLRQQRRLKGFENRVLSRVFGPKSDEGSVVNYILIICTGHVVHMGRGEVYAGSWWGNLRERDHFEDLGVDGRIILKWIFRNRDAGHELN